MEITVRLQNKPCETGWMQSNEANIRILGVGGWLDVCLVVGVANWFQGTSVGFIVHVRTAICILH